MRTFTEVEAEEKAAIEDWLEELENRAVPLVPHGSWEMFPGRLVEQCREDIRSGRGIRMGVSCDLCETELVDYRPAVALARCPGCGNEYRNTHFHRERLALKQLEKQVDDLTRLLALSLTFMGGSAVPLVTDRVEGSLTFQTFDGAIPFRVAEVDPKTLRVSMADTTEGVRVTISLDHVTITPPEELSFWAEIVEGTD